MNTTRLHFNKKWPAFSAMSAFFWLAASAGAQSMPAQNPARTDQSTSTQDRNTNRQDLAQLDQFLDQHREIAEQVRKDPSLLNDQKFVKSHPALRSYLQDHPELRQDLKENPKAFAEWENRDRHDEMGRNDRDITRPELARFDRFLDDHREVARQLRQNPSLINDQQFLKDHPELQTYLKDHPAVRQEITENPIAFKQREDRYDQREDGMNQDRDANRDRDDHNNVRMSERDSDRRQEMGRFDQFLDGHREIAEQLRRNPSLANDQQFLKDHPALQSYLQDHPEIREELTNDPDAFRQHEAEYRNTARDYDDGRGHSDRDAHTASFHEFLGTHSNVAQELNHDPSLAKNHDYLENHPELQSYLSAHPEVREELMANPAGFVKSAQQFNSGNNVQVNGQPVKTPAPPTTADPSKSKQ
jgi:hypothetical protein